MGLKNIMWDYDTEDWRLFNNPNAFPGTSFEDSFRDKAISLESSPKGMIAIQHDLYENAMKRVGSSLDALLKTKMYPMPASECVSDFTPYNNKNLVLPKSGSVEKVPLTGSGGSTTGSGNDALNQKLSLVAALIALAVTMVIL
jgi:hypothetical protein